MEHLSIRRARRSATAEKHLFFWLGMIADHCTCNETDILNNSGQVNYVFLTFLLQHVNFQCPFRTNLLPCFPKNKRSRGKSQLPCREFFWGQTDPMVGFRWSIPWLLLPWIWSVVARIELNPVPNDPWGLVYS